MTRWKLNLIILAPLVVAVIVGSLVGGFFDLRAAPAAFVVTLAVGCVWLGWVREGMIDRDKDDDRSG